MAYEIERAAYADMFGPTVGDRVRLADTELFIEVERDLTTYGEEVKFGGGKVIRDGMGQSQASRASGAVDSVITNALIVDHSGIYKADIGITGGRIKAIGKAGNPDVRNLTPHGRPEGWPGKSLSTRNCPFRTVLVDEPTTEIQG